MARATLEDSNCPCQEDYGEGPCWCYVVISHDPVLNILKVPYYGNPFGVVPIDREYFIENIIVTCFEQTTSNLSNWRFQYPNCPYGTLTKYSGCAIYWINPQNLHLMCCKTLKHHVSLSNIFFFF